MEIIKNLSQDIHGETSIIKYDKIDTTILSNQNGIVDIPDFYFKAPNKEQFTSASLMFSPDNSDKAMMSSLYTAAFSDTHLIQFSIGSGVSTGSFTVTIGEPVVSNTYSCGFGWDFTNMGRYFTGNIGYTFDGSGNTNMYSMNHLAETVFENESNFVFDVVDASALYARIPDKTKFDLFFKYILGCFYVRTTANIIKVL